jgi:hypothetical protein
MPTYLPPNLNVPTRFWLPGNPPGGGGGSDYAGSVQVYEPTRTIFGVLDNGALKNYYVPVEFRCDHKMWNLVGLVPMAGGIFKIVDPFATACYYLSIWWDYVHWDFPNMYILHHTIQCDSFGTVPDPQR